MLHVFENGLGLIKEQSEHLHRQDAFIKEMTIYHERSNQKKLETTKGWYSECDMKEELGWKPILAMIIMSNLNIKA